MGLVQIVSAHHERAVVHAGGIYLKVETNAAAAFRERAAIAVAPIPAPTVLWWHDGPPALLALEAVPGTSLAKLGEPSPHPEAAWAAAGAVARQLHTAEAPEGLNRGPGVADLRSTITTLRAWLLDNTNVAADIIEARASFAHDVLDHRLVEPVFTHGDLQAEHVLIDDACVVAVVDWSEAGPGDPLRDLAALTQGHRERLDDVIAGYGIQVDRDAIRGYWTLGKLNGVRFMLEHGFDASGDIAALVDVSND